MLLFPNHDKSRRGFNLIEAAIVLGVVGLIIGGIWVAASAVQESRRQSRFLEQVTQIIPAIRKTFQGVDVGRIPFGRIIIRDLTTPDPTRMPKASWSVFLPADMIGSGEEPQGPWDGSFVTIVIFDDSIQIYLGGLYKTTCVALAPRLYAMVQSELYDTGDGLHVFDIQDNNILDTPSDAATGCMPAESTPDSYGFYFYIRR